MSRCGRRYGVVLGLAATFVAAPSQATTPAWMVEELRERYSESYIEVQSVIEQRIDEWIPLVEQRG